MSLSISNGFRRGSECPNQYTTGRSADVESAVAADVAVNPRGLAGEMVWIGESTGHADRVPGTVHPPWEIHASAVKSLTRDRAHFTRVDIDKHR